MDRHIISFEIPALGIALARLADPLLRNRPVALAPAPISSRTLLHEVSREARGEGLAAGMPVVQARRLCPALRILPPDPVRLRQATQCLHDVAARFAPVWEPWRPGHLYLDLTGTSRLFGPASDTAARLEREVAGSHGLAGVVGVASTKLVSHIAAGLVAPLELCEVWPGSERAFLTPLPVTALPGLSRCPKSTAMAMLEDLNIATLGELGAVPRLHLELVLGEDGPRLHDWAHGLDPSPVLPPPRRSRIEESLTLTPDELDEGVILGVLYGVLERLCRELRGQRRLCRRLALTLRHSDHVVVEGINRLPFATQWEAELFPPLEALFRRRFRRRVRLRSMTVGLEGLVPAEAQLSLFPASPASSRTHRLALALDRLRARFGDRAISLGRTISGPLSRSSPLTPAP